MFRKAKSSFKLISKLISKLLIINGSNLIVLFSGESLINQ